MSSRIRIVLIISAVAGLAFWLSYRRAYTASMVTGASETSSRIRARQPHPIGDRSDKMEVLRQLLKRPVNARTNAEEWAIISGFSISQIEQALKAMPEGYPSNAVRAQEVMLYAYWAQIDPLAAAEAANRENDDPAKFPSSQQILMATYSAWMKRDPDAAYRSALASPKIRGYAFDIMAKHLAVLPMEDALAKAKAYDPVVRQRLLERLGANGAGTVDERDAFLAKLTGSGSNPEDIATGLKSFIQYWGMADPKAALEGMKRLSLDEKNQQEAGDQIIGRWTEKDPAAALAWMMTGENAQPLPKQVDVYYKWALASPEEATKHLDTLANQSPGFREALMKSLLTAFYQGGWSIFGRNDSTDLAYFSRLKNHYDQWMTSDPEIASAWVKTLEPALQQRIHTPGLHETH